MSGTSIVEFTSFKESVYEALDQLGAAKVLSEQSHVLVKPNLVTEAPPPVTTPVDCCEAVVQYVKEHSKADVIVAEGCGSASSETSEVFEMLGYLEMADENDVELLDLNHAPLKQYTNPECPALPEIYLPEIAFTHYIISVPVLKAHSLAIFTGTLKNMMGFAPPEYYGGGRFGSWKKATFHGDMQQMLIDLNRYRLPDLSVLDASIGLSDFHLGGPECHPPVGKILADYDAVALDREAAGLLGMNWRDIQHLAYSYE